MRMPPVFADPEADPPVYPWRSAPAHLLTRGQLRARGLRPGPQSPAALVLWASRRGGRPRIDGYRFARLYDLGAARPVLPVTPARAHALALALAARQTCPECQTRQTYVLSSRLGVCNSCASNSALAA
jgi:hypothetical protein